MQDTLVHMEAETLPDQHAHGEFTKVQIAFTHVHVHQLLPLPLNLPGRRSLMQTSSRVTPTSCALSMEV